MSSFLCEYQMSSTDYEDVELDEESKCQSAFTFKKDRIFYRNWIGFFILGTINNLAYVIVNSSAQSLTDSFDSQKVSNLFGLIPAANVTAGLFARSLSTALFDRVSTKGRIGANGLTMFASLGLLGIAATPGSPLNSYWICLVFIVILGGTSSFGESSLVGYIRRYPPELVDGWSSGTGMAGILGAGLYLALDAAGLEAWQIYFICLPSVVVYLIAFHYILVPPEELSESYGYTIQEKDSSEKDQLLDSKDEGPKGPTLQKYIRCLKMIGWLGFNLFAVYFFEYVASTGAADRAEDPNETESGFFSRQSYAILAFLYQVGVFISRSSLSFVKISKVWILTVLQGINFVLWVLQATFHFMPIWLQFILMVYVGLLGGAGYVNICYIVLNSPSIPDIDRELCVNMIMYCITFGIFSASAFTILMDETWLSDY